MHADEVLAALLPTVTSASVPGVVVGVRDHGVTTVAADGNLERHSQVRLSSNTKPLIAALALTLAADGVLALDDPVERFVPELADRRVLTRLDGTLDETVPAARSITVDDLLTMRMGFGWAPDAPDGRCPAVERATELGLGFGPPEPHGPPPPDEWIARFATLPLLDTPGSTWRYELSFAVLGVLLARAGARPLGDLLTAGVLHPLGLHDTGFVADATRLVPQLVHTDDDGLVELDGVADSAWLRPPAFPDGRGGLVGTVDDLLRFAGALLDGTWPHLAAMTRDRLTPAQHAGPVASMFLDGGGWGYGVGVGDSRAGRRHGWAGGFGTLWYSWPEHDLAAVLVTQVLPPTGPVFEAFTDAVEAGLTASGARA